jgi:hypothetical protein
MNDDRDETLDRTATASSATPAALKKIEAGHTYHCLYLAIHRAHKEAPDIWKIQDCTRILTAIMAVRSFSWHVAGITKAAFAKCRESDFKRPKEKITRAHLKQRIETARSLMTPSEPYVESEFFKIWLENDKTVLCVRGENKTPVPQWEDIENPDGELFPSTLGGFRHGPREQEHLRAMAMKFSSWHVPRFSRPSTSSERKPPLPELMAAVECYNSILSQSFPLSESPHIIAKSARGHGQALPEHITNSIKRRAILGPSFILNRTLPVHSLKSWLRLRASRCSKAKSNSCGIQHETAGEDD